MDTVADMRVGEFSDVLSSKAPVPGGGGASAVAAAVGASLGQMVASLTLGKKRYADVQGRIEELIPRFEAVRDELLVLADEDAKAFEPLSRAYGLPKGTEEERVHKAEVMEAALRAACEPPLKIMEKTCEAIDLVDEVSRIGTRIAISDAGAGATLLSAALKAVSLNIFINAKSMADREYAEDLLSHTQEMLDEGCKKADDAYVRVERGIRWPSR
ncbi:cyclodeaminase/cyclohydrolase family protein [Olsenella sp. kh2p3]|jgi:formiminotetrahydrofolate cyclodeaminase|uniref:cyclodeaminase/cyclohydrolase family protein n=1 Tax=Olsenella sp. kh2p3 TaxID=1797112 RepID=UPI0009247207|nr:cyclodeaminase/cyclohydrolase family protein [Olsenella sp. kh2p3]MCI2086307.1 cyclodeaminase/cyclohydrolase family protein [Olsenella sp.]SFX26076.1 Formimidoyltetrahydrofolate cyclodeaminase [Olsenella sp. kh2p3]